jgi:hypothetical protein
MARWSSRDYDFLIALTLRPSSGQTQPRVSLTIFHGVNRRERAAGQSTLSNIEVQNQRSYASSPYVFVAWYLMTGTILNSN